MNDFDAWLELTARDRGEIIAFSKLEIFDVDRAIQMSDECGKLELRAEWYLKQLTAQAMLTSKEDFPGRTAKEREILVRDKMKDIQYFVDGLAVTGRTIRDRIYNTNRRSR